MASLSLSNSHSAPSSSSHTWKYDVFLSFRGKDTRKIFVDHLYSALVERLIHTYKDDKTLPRGESINPALLKAIQESRIAVIVFSKNYADSSWCLDELAYIMKCRDERGQIVLPIFYHVEPSEVRNQKGEFGKAFAKQELKNITKVESWRKALLDASNLSGWEPKHIANGHESVGIKKIVDAILDKLFSLNPYYNEDLVGMGTRMQHLKSQLKIGSGGVLMVGIWGIGGSGKTTLASSIYMEISQHFEAHCIVDSIREESHKHGLKSLQEKFLLAVLKSQVGVQSITDGQHKIKSRLCRSKVLIVLDDVDDLDQLEALAGSHNWFGGGSRIIITTRDAHLLTTHDVDVVSPVSLLSNDEAICLFNRHAISEKNIIEDYETLSLRVVSYAAGLPLALKILGSFLKGQKKNGWMSTLDRLKIIPNRKVMDVLKISYDGLEPYQKELFLDIACFFRGEWENEVVDVLDACGFYPSDGVEVLRQKALISILNGKFDMHDLVQEMGYNIIRGEYPNNPEAHKRVWRYAEIEDMCSRNGTTSKEYDKIEAVRYDGESSLFPELVSNMKKLRLLYVPSSHFVKLFGSKVIQGPTFLSNELRCIHWTGYPPSPFPKDFQPTKLVVLRLEMSMQTELWRGFKLLPHLKELNLQHAKNLLNTPDFDGLPCLQKLSIEHCGSLEEIHSSLGYHKSLVSVILNNCWKLRRFPTVVQMKKLKKFKITNCGKILKFPEIKSNMDSLVQLYLGGVGIEVIPSFIGERCTNLISLEWNGLGTLKRIEGNFRALNHLQKFICRVINEVEKLPKDLFDEKCCLEELSLPRIRKPHLSLEFPHLPRFLKKLDISSSRLEDGEVPTDIGELFNLQELNLSYNSFSRLPFSLSQLNQLKLLNLTSCDKLVELPELPSSIHVLTANNCYKLKLGKFHKKCKRLYYVGLIGVSLVIGGNELLQTMLQEKAIKNRIMSLQLQGLEIPKMFMPPLKHTTSYTLDLPENWYNDFSGFLICAVLTTTYYTSPTIYMNPCLMDMDCRYDVVWEERYDDIITWVGYVSFGLLRHTEWWDSTYKAIRFWIDVRDTMMGRRMDANGPCSGFGVRLVPGKNDSDATETTNVITDDSGIFDKMYDFRNKIWIRSDSKSGLSIGF